MNSKKSIILIILVAVLGALLFHFQSAIQPSVSFLIGVVASVLVLSLSKSSTQTTKQEGYGAPTQTLYVGNLPYKANESNVRQLFSEHGEVFAVRLMKDKRTGKRRGFGFVIVAEADAQKVIIALNEQDYMQRTLKVRVANDPKHPETE